VNPRHIIQRTGDKIDTVSTLKRGWACSFIQFPDGRRQIVSFLLPGDPIGVEAVYFGAFTATHSVQALTHATVCAFNGADMLKLMGSAEDGLPFFARYLVKHRIQAERRLASIGRKRAIGRLAQLLLEILEIATERNLLRDGAIDFPLRQEHVADALGLTPSHVNRTMLTLRRAGIIEVARGKLRVLDAAQLKLIAENN
jgi:CRP-like cAMP-binding protein